MTGLVQLLLGEGVCQSYGQSRNQSATVPYFCEEVCSGLLKL